MELFTSFYNLYNTVSEADREYSILARKLAYELKKSNHLLLSQKIKSVPDFMIDHLKHTYQDAKLYFQMIQSMLKQDSLALKDKIRLSMPFNKTNQQVKHALQQLQKAQSDVNNYSSSSQAQDNGKRFASEYKSFDQKKQQTKPIQNANSFELNDDDIQEAIMGPTIQEDVALGFTRNKYIKVNVQIMGQNQLINRIRQVNQSLLTYSAKQQIQFESTQNKLVDQIDLFKLGRVYFKPVYSKIKPFYPEIDRFSKQCHFIVKLRRRRQSAHDKTQCHQTLERQTVKSQTGGDQFFSFPGTEQAVVYKEVDTVLIQRTAEKNNLFFVDATGIWIKMEEMERQICKGDKFAAFISPNKEIPIPDIYFKINFEIIS